MRDMASQTVTDGLGRFVVLDKEPKRIISLVPSLTEWLFDLGLQQEVVGITKFCVRPPHWRSEKQMIGGTKNLNLDRIRALNPDLIIANREENEQSPIEELMREFPVYVSDVRNVGMALKALSDIAQICRRKNQSDLLIHDIQLRLRRPSPITKSTCIYLIWQEPFMTISEDTFIFDMLTRSGFNPILFGSKSRYPSISITDIAEANPQFILLSSEPFPFGKQHEQELKKKFPNSRTVCVDGEMFSWYGSRLLHFEGWKYQSLVDNSNLEM